MKSATNNTVNQGIGAYVEYINSVRADELQGVLGEIANKLNEELTQQDINLIKALKYVDNVRDFVSKPNEILGSELTKHGEIAEQIDVNINNARCVLNGLKERFTFEGVGRTAPEDYLDGVQAVQSKFYNGLNNTLRAVLEHKEKYQYFGSDGQSYYSIPKDYYETIQKILNGENVDNLNGRTIETAKKLIEEIEKQTNRPFNDVVKPSISDYSDVQLGKVNETLDNEQASLSNQADANKEVLKNNAKNDKAKAIDNSGPSVAEAAKVTGVAAAVSGGMSFIISVARKKKEGKSITQFTADDWKDIGIDTGKGTLKGGVSGLSIYTLTNFANTPAPLASAYVSAVFGVVNLAKQYRNGEITSSDFIENSQLVCMDSAISAIGAGLGSVIIPVPVLGAVVGSIVANTMSSISKDYLEKKEQELIGEYNRKYMIEIGKLDNEHAIILSKIMQEYYMLGEITIMAFDFNLNSKLRFEKSIDIARLHNVNEDEILKNKYDIDRYFLD